VTEPTSTDQDRSPADQPRRVHTRRRTRLPSEQVLQELAAIPDLAALAKDLRDRLTDSR